MRVLLNCGQRGQRLSLDNQIGDAAASWRCSDSRLDLVRCGDAMRCDATECVCRSKVKLREETRRRRCKATDTQAGPSKPPNDAMNDRQAGERDTRVHIIYREVEKL